MWRFFIVQKSFNAAGFRGPVHIDSALCGKAGWIWIILQSRYYHHHPTCVVDPGCLSPGSGFCPSRIQRSKRHRILDLDTQYRIEKIIYVLLTQRLLLSSWNDVCARSRIARIFSTLPDPGSGIPDPGVKKHWIPDKDQSHTVLFEIFLSRLMFLHHFVTRIPYLMWEGGDGKRSIILSLIVKNEDLLFQYNCRSSCSPILP